MNYTNTSSEFIKCFLPIINKNNVEETKILKIIYNDIYKAYKENINNKCLKGNLQKITDINKAKQSRIYNSKFFPSYIKKYIRENELYQLIYTCNINSRIIKIYFTLFSEEEVLNVEGLVQLIITTYGKGSYENLGARTYHEANYLKLNVDLAKTQLGWELLYTNRTIVEKTIQWYKAFEAGVSATEITNQQIHEYLQAIS